MVDENRAAGVAKRALARRHGKEVYRASEVLALGVALRDTAGAGAWGRASRARRHRARPRAKMASWLAPIC